MAAEAGGRKAYELVDAAAWIGPSEAARLLGITYVTLRRYIDRGWLEAVVTPIGRLVSRASVDARLRARDPAS